MDRTKARRDRLRRRLRSRADAMLVTNDTNVTYLTGFTGDDSYLLVTPNEEILITDFRYITQLSEECPHLELHVRKLGESLHDGVEKVTKQAKASKLAVEADSMTVAVQAQLSKSLPKVEFVPIEDLILELRSIKDKEEIEEIRFAVQLAERAFAVARASLHPEQTELQIANLLDRSIRDFGGRGLSFTPIVAVGPRAALPHAPPTDKKVCESDQLLIDWGAWGRLYLSDLTRVLVTGKLSAKLERIYQVVLEAQLQAISAIKPGQTMNVVDAAARSVIAKAGYGKNFGHGLGHGIGLQIHELPRLAAIQKEPLKAGMIVTVEPGIYIPGWGGVRIEDDILVTRSGHEVLSSMPKELGDCVIG